MATGMSRNRRETKLTRSLPWYFRACIQHPRGEEFRAFRITVNRPLSRKTRTVIAEHGINNVRYPAKEPQAGMKPPKPPQDNATNAVQYIQVTCAWMGMGRRRQQVGRESSGSERMLRGSVKDAVR